jgi:phosphoribosylglycinamide formyltransferase, formyltetrahydrofolate-dependent
VTRARVAVLASGGGSNLQAVMDYLGGLGDRRAADIVLVASNKRDAGALERARTAGIPTAIIKSSRDQTAEELLSLLQRNALDLVVCAGYLQLVPAEVTRAYRGRILNVHPAPLPQFGGAGMYGRHVHRAVLEAKAPYSGPTVHFVDEQYDHGATIAHWPVPVLPDDNEHTLADRVLRAEHLLLPRVVQRAASGGRMPENLELQAFDPSLTDEQLARSADEWFSLTASAAP